MTIVVMLFIVTAYPKLSMEALGQDNSIRQVETGLKNLFGIDKLKALNRLTNYYEYTNSRKALRYGRQAVILGENIFIESSNPAPRRERVMLIQAYYQLGKVLYNRESYFDSKDYLEEARTHSIELNDTAYLNDAIKYLDEIQTMIDSGKLKESFLSRSLGNLKVGEAISETSKDIAIQSQIKIGKVNEKKGDYEAAIDHYKQAINLLKDKGDGERISELQLKVAVLLDSLNQFAEAQEYLNEAIIEREEDLTVEAISGIDAKSDIVSPPIETLPERRRQETLKNEQQNLKNLAESYASEKNFEKSLEYYKLFQELSQKMESDSLQSIIDNKRKEGEMILLRQQKEIADLNISAIELEKEKEVRLRNMSVLIGLLILIAAVVVFYYYTSKKKQHKQLTVAFDDLDKTKGKLINAEQRITKLLTQQVSDEVAKELLSNNTDKQGERRFVCVMFLDIRGFTSMAEKMSPEELISFQNNVFGFMMDIIQKHSGTVNQVLGDGFMATFGAPVSKGNDCQNAFLAANEILVELKIRNEAGSFQKTKIGIGLHAGNVVTGNVGNEKRKQYSVTGNAVIIASRVEELNKEFKSQLIITREVYEKLDHPPDLPHPFHEVSVKGRSVPLQIATMV